MPNNSLNLYFDGVKPKKYRDELPNLYGTEKAVPSLQEPSLSRQDSTIPLMPPLSTGTTPLPLTAPTMAAPSLLTDPNAGMGAPQETMPAPPSPVDTFSDYWKTPIIGKMPLDKFVQIAGMLSKSINPNEPMGRIGADLYQMGGLASAERARREERESDRQLKAPEDALRMRSLKAQVEQAEKPKQWKEFSESFAGKINEKTGLPFTKFEIERKWFETEAVPTIPKEPSYHYVVDDKGNVSAFAGGQLISGSGQGATKTQSVDGRHYEVNDQGVVSYYEKGKLISGPGTGKTKTLPDPDKGRTGAFDKTQKLQENNINIRRELAQTTDDMGKKIVRSPTEDAELNKMLLANEAEIKRLSEKYPDLIPPTTQPATAGTLTPEQIKTSKEMYADLTSKGMSSIDAIKAINAKLDSIQPSQSESKTTTKQPVKEKIPPEPPEEKANLSQAASRRNKLSRIFDESVSGAGRKLKRSPYGLPEDIVIK